MPRSTYLEMTDPRQLRPGRVSPAVSLVTVGGSPPMLRSLHHEIAVARDWSSRYWPDGVWRRWATRPGMRHWVTHVGNEPAGVASVRNEGDGNADIHAFGLVSRFVGHGHGGHALTLVVRAAWVLEPAVGRIWLRTSDSDHPHALPNYRARGFTVYRTAADPVITDASVFDR